MAARDRGPDFLYVGTSKAGSTWLFNALSIHPEAFLPSFKGLYFFDHHYDNGLDWYLDQFTGVRSHKAVGEISHSYLSSPEAPGRIAELNPGMRLLVCLREPVDRAFSDYLDLRKNGQYDGSFEEALERFPRLLERGRYADHLERYLAVFPRDQLHVSLFDDLKTDAQGYADDVFDFLGIERLQLPPASLKNRMPAGTPRNVTAARAAKTVSRWAKDVGLNSVRSRVKRSVLIRQALYRPYADARPTMDPLTRSELRRSFATEVDRLDGVLGIPVSTRWEYRPAESGAGRPVRPFP